MEAPKVEIIEEGKFVTLKVHNCRTMYAHVAEPRRDKKNIPTGYSCDFLVPKGTPGIEQAKEKVRSMGISAFKGPGWKCPIIKDGDKAYEEFVNGGGDKNDKMKLLWRGHYIISGNSTARDRSTRELIPVPYKGNVYSGCFASAKFNVKDYDFIDDKTGMRCFGIKGYLEGVVFKADGEHLGRSVTIDDLGEAGVSTQGPADSYREPPTAEQSYEPDPW